MDIYREFERRPPRERLDSLDAVVRDWKWRVDGSHLKRDGVVEWTAAAGTWYVAVHRAVFSRDARGKMHNHQTKVPVAIKTLLFREIMKSSLPVDVRSFDHLYDVIASFRIWGIGSVTVYDVSVRIGAWLQLEPDSLYLHAGVKQGWKALGLPRWDSVRVYREDWPLAFQSMPADELEDFICTYRLLFKREGLKGG